MNPTPTRDVIIVGAGAAGLSAGLVLARAQADVLLIDSGQPRNAAALEMHGVVSRDGMSPAEFLASGRREATGYGATIVAGTVSTVERRGESFTVTLADGTVESARALLAATGLTDELPRIPGLRDRWGTLVHHCPYCHGYEVLGRVIAVIGGPAREMSLKQAALLRSYSDRITFITNGIELTGTERHRLESFGVRVTTGVVSHLSGRPGSLDGVALADGTTVPCEAAFVAPQQRPNDAVLRSLGCDLDPATGLASTNTVGQTSVTGVWAAGNVDTPSAQIVTAAGAGSASAIAINGWLLQKDLDAASAVNPTEGTTT